MRFFRLLLFTVMLSSQYGYAIDWTEVGNGGDVLICNTAPHARMFDVHESVSRYDLIPVFPTFEAPVRHSPEDTTNGKEHLQIAIDIALEMMTRLKDKDPKRYQRYSQWIRDFPAESKFLDDTYLIDVPDIGVGALPVGCFLEQLIIQKNPLFPQSKRYTIAHDFWKHMPFEHQAAAIIHEVLYREAILLDNWISSSERIRYFNSLILSDEIKNMSLEQYREMLLIIFPY